MSHSINCILHLRNCFFYDESWFTGKLRVAYNNVFRFLLCLPRDEEGRPCSASNMFVTRKVKSFDEILRNVVFKFQARLKSSNNELVCSTINKIYHYNSKLSNHWQRLLIVSIT